MSCPCASFHVRLLPRRGPCGVLRRRSARSCPCAPSGSPRASAARQTGAHMSNTAKYGAGPAGATVSVPNRNRSGYLLSIAATRAIDSRRRDRVLGDLVPRDVEVHVAERRVGQHRLDDLDAGSDCARPASAETCTGCTMRPRPMCAQMIARLRMALEQRLHLRQVDRLGVRASRTACRCRCAGSRRGRPRRRSRGCDRAPGWSGWRSRRRSSTRRTPCGC